MAAKENPQDSAKTAKEHPRGGGGGGREPFEQEAEKVFDEGGERDAPVALMSGRIAHCAAPSRAGSDDGANAPMVPPP